MSAREAAAALLLVLTLALPAGAVQPDERLADPALEARARALSQELRCLVCQNETIDDSSADLARDLRLLVRRRLQAGDGDRQVLDYVVGRYGDFVLLRPPVAPRTWALWFGPPVVLLCGAVALALYFRRRRAGPGGFDPAALDPAPLSPEERERLMRLGEGEG